MMSYDRNKIYITTLEFVFYVCFSFIHTNEITWIKKTLRYKFKQLYYSLQY